MRLIDLQDGRHNVSTLIAEPIKMPGFVVCDPRGIVFVSSGFTVYRYDIATGKASFSGRPFSVVAS